MLVVSSLVPVVLTSIMVCWLSGKEVVVVVVVVWRLGSIEEMSGC